MPHRHWEPVNTICCPPGQQKEEHGQWLIPAGTSAPLKYMGYLHMSLDKVILLKNGYVYTTDTYICC